jgi:hypothetical protein
MKEFMMIFRQEPNPNVQISPEQMQGIVKQWMDWIGGIAAQGKFLNYRWTIHRSKRNCGWLYYCESRHH